MPKGKSLYARFPDYRVDLEPHAGRVVVKFGGETLVDSEAAITVHETQHAPVIYFPRSDLNMAFFERTDHETFCPFKGEASYWNLTAGGESSANAAWSYEDPFEEVAGLKDYVSFYTDRVSIE